MLKSFQIVAEGRFSKEWDDIIPTGRTGTLSPDDIRDMRAHIDSYRTAPTL